MKVESVYTPNVVATARSSTLEEAAETMRKFHVGALLVLDDGPDAPSPIGMVTDRDLVLQGVADGVAPGDATVADVMTSSIVSVMQKADLNEALERMRTAGVRRLLVTREDGAVAGMLSVDDVVDGLATELANLAGLMKAEIRDRAEDYHHGHAI
jgi:CBS domain-containing protein